jgi:hypothetical protein
MFTNEEGETKNGIAKVRYSHDAMIDVLLVNPTIKQNDLALIFDRTPTWISLVINSDAFQARLDERQREVIDPIIRNEVELRLKAAANASLDRILDKLTGPLPVTDDFLIQSAKLATGALGYGARQAPGSGPQVNVQINLPNRIHSSNDWAAAHGVSMTVPVEQG